MIQIKNILRCYAMGMGIKGISNVFNLSRNTVRRYVHKYLDSGLTLDRLLSMLEEHLQEMFAGNLPRNVKPSANREELDALLPDYARRLSRKGTTVKSLYAEYASQHPSGYKSTQFFTLLRRYTLQTKAVGHVEHPAGDQMYIDFAGDKLEVADSCTGEVREVEVFVAILPCSQYTYCEAVWSQKKEYLIAACENAIHFYGGAPMAIALPAAHP